MKLLGLLLALGRCSAWTAGDAAPGLLAMFASVVPAPRDAALLLEQRPEVRLGELEQGRVVAGRAFPLVLRRAERALADRAALLRWLRDHREEVDEALRAHGAILFRGFPVAAGAGDFSAFVEALGYGEFEYVGGAAVRRVVAPRVFTSNESPPSEVIPFHHELAQTPQSPGKVLFYCEVAAECGGETPILHSGELLEVLERRVPRLMKKLEAFGVRYVRVMPEADDPTSALGRSWRSAFLVADRGNAPAEEAEVAAALAGKGYAFEWGSDRELKAITPVLWPVQAVEEGASYSRAFFNQIVAAYTGWNDARNQGPRAILLADRPITRGVYGTPLPRRAMAKVVAAHEELQVAFPWEAGDVLVLDNRQVMHARRSFTPPRRTLASLCADDLSAA